MSEPDPLRWMVAEALDDAMRRQGMTQAQLARQAGVSRSRICQILSAKSPRVPTLTTLAKLAAALRLRITVRF